jgi:hypothetical protein
MGSYGLLGCNSDRARLFGGLILTPVYDRFLLHIIFESEDGDNMCRRNIGLCDVAVKMTTHFIVRDVNVEVKLSLHLTN